MQGVHLRRRLVAAAILLGLVAAIVLALRACGGGDEPQTRPARAPSGSGDDAPKPAQAPPAPQLPGGGRTILPGHRVVAFYGAPQDAELGTLGIGTPDQAGRRLVRMARTYRRLGRPVLPAMELIAVVANAAPGADGLYRTRQTDATIGRYLRAARRIEALLILDIQPGRSDFLREARSLRRWLAEPDVSLALDPEWRVDAPNVPAKVIGSVGAEEVNAVSYWLDGLVRERRLPQKLLLVHRFTHDMIRDQARLKPRPGLATTINVDGFGGRAIKRAKYREFATGADRFFDGFKLFFKEDTDVLTARQVARLRPSPDVVVYE